MTGEETILTEPKKEEILEKVHEEDITMEEFEEEYNTETLGKLREGSLVRISGDQVEVTSKAKARYPITTLDKKDLPFFTDDNRPRFVPLRLANIIQEDYHFATHEESEELYVYEDGVYKPKGELVVEREAQRNLGEYTKNNYVNETVSAVKRANHTLSEKFDNPEDGLVVENGILDLETRELKEHDPEHIHLTKLPVKYDPDADCSEVKKFVKSLVGSEDDVKKIQEMLGYTLLKRNPLNKAFMGLGPGGNGRSTLFDLFQTFLGEENTAGVDLSALVRDRFASADLYGTLANFCADISNRKIKHSGRFKKLVGEDRIRAQHKNEDAFHFKCYSTPWFSANELPETLDKTRSWYRRWVIINFPFTFTSDPEELEKEGFKEKDPELPEPLKTEEELSGLLNWALDGLDRVMENKKFTNERSIKEKRELWELESDPIKEFLEKWCVRKEDGEVPKEVIRQAYQKFCEENDYNVLSPGPLTKRLKSHGVTTSRPRTEKHGRIGCYKGILLKESVVTDKELVKVVKPFLNSLSCTHADVCAKQSNSTLDHFDQKERKEEILEFFNENPKAEAYELSEEFGIEYDEAVEIIDKLVHEGELADLGNKGYKVV